MKTIEKLATYESQCFDSRDISRLSEFMPYNHCKHWFKDTYTEEKHREYKKEYTRNNILIELVDDLQFAFKKALDKKGLSANCMYNVIKMWMWVLDDELHNYNNNEYRYYGLPFLKQVAIKYNLPNPIGDDHGNEEKYA